MSNPSARVYIGRLPQDAQAQDLERMFGAVGAIEQIVLKETFAFVQFQNASQAEEAVARFDNAELLGEQIRVQPARNKREEYQQRGSYDRRDDGRGGYDRRPSDYPPPPPRYDDRPRYDSRRPDYPPPSRYDDYRSSGGGGGRGYPPPPPRSDYPPAPRGDYAPRYDNRRRDYDAPPAAYDNRYDDRSYRGRPSNYDDRGRGPPRSDYPPRYDSRRDDHPRRRSRSPYGGSGSTARSPRRPAYRSDSRERRQAGEVSYADVSRDDPSKGNIDFVKYEDMESALTMFQGKEMRGNPLSLRQAFMNGESTNNSGGGGYEYRSDDRRRSGSDSYGHDDRGRGGGDDNEYRGRGGMEHGGGDDEYRGGGGDCDSGRRESGETSGGRESGEAEGGKQEAGFSGEW